jgi:hypothetical protein
MQDYQVETSETSAADAQAMMDYYADVERHSYPGRDLRHPCGNPDCSALTDACFCREACRIAVEGDAPDFDDYYQDGEGVLLGNRALADAQRAVDGESLAALVCGNRQPASPAPLPALGEAPCSMNVHVEIAGRQVQVTLRGTDELEVLARLESLLQRYPVAPARATEPATPAAAAAPEKGWCPIHNLQMKEQHGKDGSMWFSHKIVDGWCKGLTKRQGQ